MQLYKKMPVKPYERPVKSISISIVSKPAKRKITLSTSRNHLVCIKSLFFFKVLAVFGFFILSANGMTILKSKLGVASKQIDGDKGWYEATRGRDWMQIYSEHCAQCFSSDLFGSSNSRQASIGLDYEHPKKIFNMKKKPKINKFRLPCDQLSYSRCLILYRLLKKAVNYPWYKRLHLTPSIDTRRADEPRRQIALNEAIVEATTPSLFEAKSRQKRLARGDRRLVHLYCRTHFVLEILDDGRVVGSPRKSENGESGWSWILLFFFWCLFEFFPANTRRELRIRVENYSRGGVGGVYVFSVLNPSRISEMTF